MANYTCLLLDVDNTLLDFNAAERAAVGITLEHYGMPNGPEALETYHQINRQLWDSLAKGGCCRSQRLLEPSPGDVTNTASKNPNTKGICRQPRRNSNSIQCNSPAIPRSRLSKSDTMR